MATAIDEPSRAMTIVLWVLRVLMAALFVFAAFAKLTSQPQMVEGFGLLPVGQWFRYVVGLMELGAFFAQILFMHEDWIHTIVIGAILVALIYPQRDSIRGRLGL